MRPTQRPRARNTSQVCPKNPEITMNFQRRTNNALTLVLEKW
ncbi:hypothetical protein [Alloactinosynnema sp. L-07]|nr:hypothetical protein [Alloactinosynnema sp. L-07]